MITTAHKAQLILFAHIIPHYEKTAAFWKAAQGTEFREGTFSVACLDIQKGRVIPSGIYGDGRPDDRQRRMAPGERGHIRFW